MLSNHCAPNNLKIIWFNFIFLIFYCYSSCYSHSFVNSYDTLMGLVPMFHGYGLLVICMCMSFGSKVIVLKYFDPDLFLKSIETHKVYMHFFFIY